MAERRPNRVQGVEHELFWSYCDAGELRMQRCDDCRHVSWPPVTACEKCGEAHLTWERLSGKGRVISWCTFERKYYSELEIPWDTVLVELAEGPLLVSNPYGFKNAELDAETDVVVRFIDSEDDSGAFQLPVFERA